MRLQSVSKYNMSLILCNTNLDYFFFILKVRKCSWNLYFFTKAPTKHGVHQVQCIMHAAVFWKIILLFTWGWRKLNSVAYKWNHKIYLSRHYQSNSDLSEAFSETNYRYPARVSTHHLFLQTITKNFRPYNYTSGWVWLPTYRFATRLNAARSLQD